MATSFATMTAPVVVEAGPNRMEARDPQTQRLLGTAVRNSDPHGEWIGWLVRCGTHREVVISRGVAATVLIYLTSRLGGV